MTLPIAHGQSGFASSSRRTNVVSFAMAAQALRVQRSRNELVRCQCDAIRYPWAVGPLFPLAFSILALDAWVNLWAAAVR